MMAVCDGHEYRGPTECPECQKIKNTAMSAMVDRMAVNMNSIPVIPKRQMHIASERWLKDYERKQGEK